MRNLVVRTDYKVFIIFRISAMAQGVPEVEGTWTLLVVTFEKRVT
jgi:hypothetical protein